MAVAGPPRRSPRPAGTPRRSARAPRALHVVVTAGPTREHLDDVRFLSNGSTGRMGIELAREAARRGARVTLVLGPTSLAVPGGLSVVRVTSTADLLVATRTAARGADVLIFAAAPADWRPARRRRGKPSKASYGTTLRLRPTPDVAAALARSKGRRLHVGFALESGRAALARAREKLRAKGLDAIVLNGPENLGVGGGAAWWLVAGGRPERLSSDSKAALARAILERVLRQSGS